MSENLTHVGKLHLSNDMSPLLDTFGYLFNISVPLVHRFTYPKLLFKTSAHYW